MAHNSITKERQMAMICGDLMLESANKDIEWSKKWFVQQMASVARQAKNAVGRVPDEQCVANEYLNLFEDGQEPSSTATSWAMLFWLYKKYEAQAKALMPSLMVPDVKGLMDKVTENSSWKKEYCEWFHLPIEWLRSIEGMTFIQDMDRGYGRCEGGFSTKLRGSNLGIGYVEYFNITKFGEIICETDNEEVLHLADMLIAVPDFVSEGYRYYSILMVDRLPEKVFGCRCRGAD